MQSGGLPRAETLSGESLWKALEDDGQTKWVHSLPPRLSLTEIAGKGTAVVTHQALHPSVIAFSNQALVAVATESSISALCPRCWRSTTLGVASLICASVKYCSAECRSDDHQYIERCGGAINSISRASSPNFLSSHLLALGFLYALVASQTQADVQQALQAFYLCSLSPCCFDDQSLREADLFFSILSADASELLRQVHSLVHFDREKSRSLFSIIRLNCQTMVLHSAGASHSVLCLLPAVARLNHSCQPNCELVASLLEESPREQQRPRARRIVASLVAVADVSPLQELTISYISNLHEGGAERRQLLHGAFFFHCSCSRCSSEVPVDACPHNPMCRGQCKLLAGQGQLDSLLASTSQGGGSSREVLSIEASEKLIPQAELFLQSVLEADIHGLRWSVSSAYHASMLIVRGYAERFVALQENMPCYVRFGLVFFRAVRMAVVCWKIVHCPGRLVRLELMARACMHAALTWKKLATARTLVSEEMRREAEVMVVDAISLGDELVAIIDEVYLPHGPVSARESQSAEDVTGTLMYMQLLRSKAARSCRYLSSVLR